MRTVRETMYPEVMLRGYEKGKTPSLHQLARKKQGVYSEETHQQAVPCVSLPQGSLTLLRLIHFALEFLSSGP